VLRGEWFARAVRSSLRRPLIVLGVLGVLVAGALFLATRLAPSASTDTLVGEGSSAYQATQRFKREFGDEAVVVLVRGELQRLVLTPNLGQMTALEGCIGGNPPPDAREKALAALPPVCREFAELKPAKAVYGPGTFINTAITRAQDWLGQRANSANQQAEAAAEAARKASKERGDSRKEQQRLADSARQVVMSQFQRDLIGLAVRYNITSRPDSIEFISALVFDGKGGVGAPKSRFAYLFPSKDAAMITVRLRPDLTDEERSRAIDMIGRATRDPAFRIDRGRYVVSGVPVVVDGLADAVQRSIFVLLAAALIVMAGTLALVFRTRLRLLPLALALCAAGLTYGGLALVGGTLTMASIAVLPVLIGLAVDYAIQFQARWDEQRARGAPPEEAATAAAAAGGPTIAAAGLATAAGFLVLLLSPVPMVRSFAAMLVVGIVLAFVCVLTAGFVVLVRFARPRAPRPDVPPLLPRARARAAGAWSRLAATAPAHRLVAGGAAARRAWRRAFELSIERPRAVLGVAAVVALLGLVATFFHSVESDVRKLVPQNLQALRDANELQDATGVSGEIDVTVTAKDLTDPAVIAWMTRFQDKLLADHGYREGARSCRAAKDPPELCPAVSLPDLFRSGTPQSADSVKALLDAVPRYFSQAAISADRRTANLAFGIRLMPLERQQKVIDNIERAIDDPALKRPAGVSAQVAGLPVLAAEANAKLASPWWRIGTLLGSLLLVFGVLWLLNGRDARIAGVPLIPVALASGWSGAVLWLLHIPLNPMSVTLGALVVAIATEFSVLISARYREERAAGSPPVVAIERAYVSTGAAVVASGVTAIAGFAVLIASDIAMLRQFGISTVVDLGVALLGVLLVLPAALLWAEEHGRFTLRDLDPRPIARAAARGIRRPRPRTLARFTPTLPRRRGRRA
jgi:hydrophobe/amphiphile efflux-3 (HAE3) family protein